MFIMPLTSIPDLQPHITTHILAGPHIQEAVCYFVTVNHRTVCVTGGGQVGQFDRFEFMRMLQEDLHSASVKTLHLHHALLECFVPGVDFNGDDKSTFNILNGVIRAYCDYHTVRKRGYKCLAAEMESNLESVSDSSHATAELIKALGVQFVQVSTLADTEGSYADDLKLLAHATQMYGKSSNSLVYAFDKIKSRNSRLLREYL